MLWRQGDVLIEQIDAVPREAVRRQQGVLAEGEATGHQHRVADPASAVLFALGDDLFLLVIAEQATLVHEEHGPIVLERGWYRVWRQREYSPRQHHRMVID